MVFQQGTSEKLPIYIHISKADTIMYYLSICQNILRSINSKKQYIYNQLISEYRANNYAVKDAIIFDSGALL